MDLFAEKYNVATHFDINADAILLNGDTFDVSQKLPDNYFKLIVSSPPYNIGKVYEKEVKLEEYLEWQKKLL